MKTKETSRGYGVENSPNQRLLSIREQALAWWNKLSLEEKFYKVIPWLKNQDINVAERHPNTLTGREIEEIWRKETKDGSDREIIEHVFESKPNQKQFKQFDESLFKAYIDKFSNEDKLKMLAKLSCEISTVNPILNDLLNRISCYGGNK